MSLFNVNKRKQEASAEAEYAEKRHRTRIEEFQESYALLLELVHQEPTFTQAFRIIQTQILQGEMKVHIDGCMASAAFMRFAKDNYTPFCREAIKAMFAYGFVPWHFRRLISGDLVPEVLAAGTFTWSIIQGDAAHIQCDYGNDASKSLLYDVKLTHAGNTVRREDVFIFEVTQPTWNISQGSHIHSCYPSPLSHIITDYKNLRTAMQNRANADAWNTQAHIITKQQSKTFQQDPTSTFLEAGINMSNQYTYERSQLQLHTRDQDIQEMFTKKATSHMPYLYTLPMDVSLEQTQQLTPCADIPFLDARLKHEISMLTGVPSELLTNKGGISNESSARTRTSTSQFHTAMDNIAQTMQKLLSDIYRRAYHPDTVEFSSMPTTHALSGGKTKKTKRTPDIQWFLEVAPPLSLDTVDDLVKLAAVEGALNAFELRRVVHMLLYGKGTPAGGASQLCTIPKNTHSNKDGKDTHDSSKKDATTVSKKD
jgi:hypothetical protein